MLPQASVISPESGLNAPSTLPTAVQPFPIVSSTFRPSFDCSMALSPADETGLIDIFRARDVVFQAGTESPVKRNAVCLVGVIDVDGAVHGDAIPGQIIRDRVLEAGIASLCRDRQPYKHRNRCEMPLKNHVLSPFGEANAFANRLEPQTVVPAKERVKKSANRLKCSKSGPQRRPRGRGDPSKSLFQLDRWIPAFAGMTVVHTAKVPHFDFCTRSSAGMTARGQPLNKGALTRDEFKNFDATCTSIRLRRA